MLEIVNVFIKKIELATENIFVLHYFYIFQN